MATKGRFFSSLKGRLLTSTGISVIALGIFISIALYSTQYLRGAIDTFTTVRTPKLMLASKLTIQHFAATRSYLFATLEKDPTARARLLTEGENKRQGLTEYFEALSKMENTPDFNASLVSTNALWKELESVLVSVGELVKKGDPKSLEDSLHLFLTKAVPISEKYVPQAKEASDATLIHTLEFQEQTEKKAKALNTTLVVFAVLCIIGLIIFGFRLANRLTRDLLSLSENLALGSGEVADAAKQINESSNSLSSSVTEQAAALQESASSIEQMSAMVTKSTENCSRSKEVSQQSHQSATQGQQVVENMIGAINEIDRSNTEIMRDIEEHNKEISDIIKVISEIGNKTKVINDIVFQTKLLSFNASVEAARAGEHGKGFAVVAEEVGNLAQMSGNAAREISSMLEASISKVEGIVTNTKVKIERLMSSSKEKVQNGSQIAKQCGEVLEKIVQNVSSVNHMVEEISSASQEQDRGIKEITKAVSQLDQVTQQNSAASQSASQASHSLSGQADAMLALVDRLSGLLEGTSSHSTETGNEPPRRHSSGPRENTPPKKSNIVSLPKKPSSLVRKPLERTSLAATGTTHRLPSENDPRFEDV